MSKISLIIQREYTQRVRKRTFILTTILMPLLLIGLMVVPVLISTYGGSAKREIVIVDQSGIFAQPIPNSDEISYILASDATYPAVVEQYPNSDGFLVIGQDIVTNPASLSLYSRESSTMDIENQIKRGVSDKIQAQRIAQSNVPQLDSLINAVKYNAQLSTFTIGEVSQQGEAGTEKASSSIASMGVAYIAGFLIYMFVFIYGAMVMQGVIEEKSSRIIEVIVSSVKPIQLMMGKIIGIALVALTQVMIWVVVVGLGYFVVLSIMGLGDSAEVAQAAAVIDADLGGLVATLTDPGYILMVVGCFVIFFVGGYLLYASMFAAIGSAADNEADTQQLQLPVTVPLILALIIMLNVMRDPNSAMAFWFSIIPFTSPIIMMARIPYGVPLWEIVLSVVLLYGTFVGMTYLAAKIYRTGIFMYGKKPTLKEMIKWARYKN